MPFWGNLYNIPTGATAPVYQSSTLGSLFSPTIGTTSSTGSTFWATYLDSQNQTATTSTNSLNRIYWIQDEQVEHAQYIALAQNRVIRTQARTAEQQREFEERRLQMQQEQHRLAQERAVALARSKELLLGHLTPAQRKSFDGKRFFVVEGGKSKQLYRIRDSGSYSANVDVLEGVPAKVTHRLCCHLSDSRVPLYDHLLAQKVWIENDEDAFLRQANRHAA